MTIDAAATAIAQSAARKTADRVAREVAAPLVEAARVEARQASADEARSVAATVAAETARSVASATASTDLPGLMDAFMEANPIPVIPGVSGVDGAKGDKGDKGDPGLNWRGAWRPNTTYRPTDAVEYDGSSYVATGTTMARPPKLPWDLLAKKGAPGLPGRDARSGGGGGGFGGGGMGGETPNLATVLAVGADAAGRAIAGLADPTNAQDAATKAYVDANAGGAAMIARAQYDLALADVPASVPTKLPFAFNYGTELLDLTDPTNPTPAESGVYSFAVTISISGLVSAIVRWSVVVTLDEDDFGGSMGTATDTTESDGFQAVTFPFYVPAGSPCYVQVRHSDVGDVSFTGHAYVQRLS